MAKQDDWVRITLRLPPDLYERVTRVADMSSVNTEIIKALEKVFPPYPSDEELAETIEYLLKSLNKTRTPAIKKDLHDALKDFADRVQKRVTDLRSV